MKKTLVLLIIGFLVFGLAAKEGIAARKTKKGPAGISQEELTSMTDSLEKYTKKVYSASLFSPEENAQMFEIKMKLDNQMLIAPDPSLAPLYYKAGNLYKAREYKAEAIECYQTIMENFYETMFYPKAKQNLIEMGVTIKEPVIDKPAEDSAENPNNLPGSAVKK